MRTVSSLWNDGKVNGFGTHEELLEQNDIYREVYESQTSGGGDFDEKEVQNKMPGPGRQPMSGNEITKVKNPGEIIPPPAMKYVLKDYKFHCISVVVLIVVSVFCNVQGTMFMKTPDRRIHYTIFIIGLIRTLHRLHMRSHKVAAFYVRGCTCFRSAITKI